jgi:hypothetical protein
MTTTFGQNLTDTQLLDVMHSAADTCVAVMALADDERHAVKAKGCVSAEQGGTLSAIFATIAQAEAQRRGLI